MPGFQRTQIRLAEQFCRRQGYRFKRCVPGQAISDRIARVLRKQARIMGKPRRARHEGILHAGGVQTPGVIKAGADLLKRAGQALDRVD